MAGELDGLKEPEKRIVITTPNKTLDSLAGKTQEQPPVVTTEEEKDEDPQVIRSFPDEDETQVTSEVDDTTTEEEGKEPNKTEPVVIEEDDNEVDLDQVAVEVDGQERSVSELLDERDSLAKRVAEIEGDSFLKGLIDHYKATGNIDAYYEAKGVDWDKKSDVDVLKIAFDKEYSDLDPKARERLWKRELADKYQIKDDLSPEELESDDYLIAQGLLQRDAKKARAAFKEGQTKYQAPVRKEEQPAQPKQFDPAAYKQKLLQQKEVQAFAKHKLLPLGIKDGAGKTLGFEPKNSEQIIEMMVDDKKFWSVFMDPETKKVNYTKLAKAYAYAQDPDFYEQSLINLGKNLHLEDRLKDQKQIDDRLNPKGGTPPQKVSFSKGFLTAALKQKK